MNIFLDKELLKEVTLLKPGIKEAFVEKDWFVTKVIEILTQNPYPNFSIIFTGGTSLSKAHKLIERFSEDIDFRLIVDNLDAFSTSKLRKILSGFKKHIKASLENHFEILDIAARDANRHMTFYLAYPTVCDPEEALRPHIKLEFTLDSLLLPLLELPVISFINEIQRVNPEIPKISCIHPVENAADKLSAVVWRIPSRIRGENDKQPDIVRHLHDLAKLYDISIKHEKFPELSKLAIFRDKDRAEILKGMSDEEKLTKVLEILRTDSEYSKEYDAYVKEMVYNHDEPVPTFDEAVAKLKSLINKVLDIS